MVDETKEFEIADLVIGKIIKKEKITKKELMQLVIEEEMDNLEHKSDSIDNFKIAKLMASLVNTDGGLVLFGVDTKKKKLKDRLVGIKDLDELNLKIASVASDLIKPKLKPVIKYEVLNNKNIIIVYVPKVDKDKFHLVRGIYY